MHFLFCRSPTCDCNNSTQVSSSTTVNPTRNNGNNGNPASGLMMMTGCSCGTSTSSTTPTYNNVGSSSYEDLLQRTAETLLSSNARFQSISAIAVAQDGVINVADQGEFLFSLFFFSFCSYRS